MSIDVVAPKSRFVESSASMFFDGSFSFASFFSDSIFGGNVSLFRVCVSGCVPVFVSSDVCFYTKGIGFAPVSELVPTDEILFAVPGNSSSVIGDAAALGRRALKIGGAVGFDKILSASQESARCFCDGFFGGSDWRNSGVDSVSVGEHQNIPFLQSVFTKAFGAFVSVYDNVFFFPKAKGVETQFFRPVSLVEPVEEWHSVAEFVEMPFRFAKINGLVVKI